VSDRSVDGVTVHRDVVHTRVDGYRPLALDLYLPDAGATAVCVYTHGGGWRVGSRRSGPGPMSPTSSRWLERLAQQGLAVAAVDYRLSGEARFPAQSHDVAAALRWLRADTTFGLGSLPFTAFGVSAGGLLASLAALDPISTCAPAPSGTPCPTSPRCRLTKRPSGDPPTRPVSPVRSCSSADS